MERNLKEALKHRRSYYAIDNQTTIPDAEIEEILDFAALHTPSAFNSQSTRMVLLLREQHRRLWDIVRNTLKKTIPAAAYASTEAKINKSFAAGYGTVLFFEDTAIIEGLQKAFPLYHEKFLTSHFKRIPDKNTEQDADHHGNKYCCQYNPNHSKYHYRIYIRQSIR